jgi:DNA-directed RNA polymerase II subunit RPB2
MEAYFRDHFYPFTKHHLDSYREFLRKYIPDVITSYNPITMVKFKNNKEESLEVKVNIWIGGKEGRLLYVDRPTQVDEEGNPVILTPHQCRLQNLTYSTHLYADVLVEYTYGEEVVEKVFHHVLLGDIPLMLHSDGCVLHRQGPKVLQAFDECPFDQGGYFIIDGKEKVVISQERMVTNRLFIEVAKDPRYSYKGWVRCATDVGEAALLPKTVEFYVLDPDFNKSMLMEDTEAEEEVEEEEEMGSKPSKREKYRGAILVSIPGIGVLPLFHLFRAFGIESDKEILEHIVGDVKVAPHEYFDFLRASVRQGSDMYSQSEVIADLKNKVRYKSNEHVHSILTNEVFPNMGTSYQAKAKFLGYLIRHMMDMIMGILPMVDRDGFGYKRVDLSGFLLSQLFHNIYKRFRKNCRDLLDQEYHYGPARNTGRYSDMIRKENIQKIISPHFMTERLQRSLKGLWGSSDDDEKQEKVQDLARISYLGFMSNLRRVNTPLDRSIKITAPHRLNAQQWGILCPFESPDGTSIGYLKNLALLAQVSFGSNPVELLGCLEDLEMVPLGRMMPAVCHVLTKVFLNGEFVGGIEDPAAFVRKLRLLRRNALINVFTSVAWKVGLNEVRVQTDPGRGCRPLVIVEGGVAKVVKKDASWFDLVFGDVLSKSERIEEVYYRSGYVSPFKKFAGLSKEAVWKKLEETAGAIEFVDIEESDTCMIAMYPKDITLFTTHLELDPSSILSIVTSTVPFANHNFAARLIFYGAQSKQAIGMYASNFSKRFDTMSYILHYTQRPIVTTKNTHYVRSDKLPGGNNAIVAIMTYSGFNQEDGIIINATSVQRGLFHTTGYKSYTAQESSFNQYQYTMFCNPLKLKKDLNVTIDNLQKDEVYQLLDEEGIIIPESFVAKGSKLAVVGMVQVQEELKEVRVGVKVETKLVKSYRDVSIRAGVHHYGIIDKVYVGRSGAASDYNRVCKVRFRKVKIPEFGDKSCSRHGQKGVIGLMLKEEDMPFSKDGVRPDIIINPHAIPSRMTIGHLVECVFAKLCSLEGCIGDGSVFIGVDLESVGDTMESKGFQKHGNEVLYNGRTGQQIEADVFIGPTYYLRLKHMVADKVHSRQSGPKDQLTRQPMSGRSKEGGLRIGEMERDVLLSFGFAQFAKERMMECSDKYTWSVCRNCGRGAIGSCRICGGNDIAVVQTPYAFKLLVQEMETMGVTPRFVMESLPEEEGEILEMEGGGVGDEPEEEEEEAGIVATNPEGEDVLPVGEEEEEELEESNEEEGSLLEEDEENVAPEPKAPVAQEEQEGEEGAQEEGQKEPSLEDDVATNLEEEEEEISPELPLVPGNEEEKPQSGGFLEDTEDFQLDTDFDISDEEIDQSDTIKVIHIDDRED